jgi:signal peptidase I
LLRSQEKFILLQVKYTDVQPPNPEPIPANSIANSQATEPKRGESLFRQLFQCLIVACLGLASYYLISTYLVQSVKVVGSSMLPTLHDSDHYLLNRWVYHFRSPSRQDIVVIRDPSAKCFSVKRIIGVGGDSVVLKDGAVYVNGAKLQEPYLSDGTPTYACGKVQEQLITCGKDQFFLLGDNRMNSADSRIYGPVSRQNILGMIVR